MVGVGCGQEGLDLRFDIGWKIFIGGYVFLLHVVGQGELVGFAVDKFIDWEAFGNHPINPNPIPVGRWTFQSWLFLFDQLLDRGPDRGRLVRHRKPLRVF